MKQGIEKALDEEIDKWIFDFGHTGGMYISPSKIVLNPHEYLKSFLRSAIETAFKEVRPKNSNLGEIISDSEGSVYPLQSEIDEENGYNAALSYYDQAVKNYLGK